MNINRRHAVAALAAAGLLWGITVPLSKVALAWLSPGWLTVARFGLAAPVLLAVAGRRGGPAGAARQGALRAAFTPAVLVAGALGYGGSVMVQNAGIARTSVTHAALLIGAVPVLVAAIAAVWYRTVAPPVAWFGFVVSLGGVGLVTVGGGGGGATLAGDVLVLVSLLLSATVTVAQGRLLTGRDPVAVTAVQFAGATLGALPVAVLTEGAPVMPAGAGPVLAVAALALGGTLAPFTLFAFGQSRVSAEVAGAFLNLEPLVGAITGAVAFGDKVGLVQVSGGLAILAGIGLSSLPLITARRAEGRRAAADANHVDGALPWSEQRRWSIAVVSEGRGSVTGGNYRTEASGVVPQEGLGCGSRRSSERAQPGGRVGRPAARGRRSGPTARGRRSGMTARGRRPGRARAEGRDRRGRAAKGLPARGRVSSGGATHSVLHQVAPPTACYFRWGARRVRSAGDRRSRAVLARRGRRMSSCPW
ncbi:MAG TPA: DMT family transporter [Streptosporangiaceae bacterium]|nr:DMT family transporter [Streptosporangiaceae bacterium]